MLFEQATRLEPNFAMAYARLAAAIPWAGKDPSPENARKAYDLRSRVGEREKYFIEAAYHNQVTENAEASRKIHETWMQLYPRDETAPYNLAGVYRVLGEHEKSLELRRQSLKLDPDNPMSYWGLSAAYLTMNQLDEARATIEQAQARKLEAPRFHGVLYQVALQQRDTAAIERELAYLMKTPGLDVLALHSQAETAAYGGQLSRARELVRQLLEKEKGAGRLEFALAYQSLAAVHEATIGSPTLAKREAMEAIRLSGDKYTHAVSAIALGLAGDAARATQVADDLEQRFPENTSMKFHYLPMIRGSIGLQSGHAAKALDVFTAAVPYELGYPKGTVGLGLYGVYLHGVAYLATRQGDAAASEFQKVLAHPGLVGHSPIGSLAHLGLGRAYAMAGHSDKARAAYQDFFALWKDADPDLPVLKEARTEFTKLR